MRLGTQQQRVLCLMASNKGELTALRKRGEDARIARSLISHGLVVDERTVEGVVGQFERSFSHRSPSVADCLTARASARRHRIRGCTTSRRESGHPSWRPG
jgi:hypothetical protein